MKPAKYVPSGVAPSAEKTVCIDFDGTIIPWGPLDPSNRGPYKDVAQALTDLRAAGYEVVILTSRYSRTWWRAEAKERGRSVTDFGEEQVTWVRAWLDQHGIPFDRITAEKVPALAYFDDRAVRIDGVYTLVKAISDFQNGLFEVAR